MDIHKNARLTFVRREQFGWKGDSSGEHVELGGRRVQRLRADRRQVDAPLSAARTGRFIRPFLSSGAVPTPHADALVQRVEQLRRQRFTGLHIAQATGLSRATVSRVLRRLGLNRQRDLEPAVPVIRYEHPAPGDLLHLDIKHLGRFTEIAVRADGRRRGKHHRGWEYLHVAIDDHSRIAFSQVLPHFTGASAVTFLRAAVAYYATLGISIRRLLTDNGHCYRSGAFREACLQLGLRHYFTRPYTPRTNGKAERFIQTALREWIYACAYQGLRATERADVCLATSLQLASPPW